MNASNTFDFKISKLIISTCRGNDQGLSVQTFERKRSFYNGVKTIFNFVYVP